MDDFGYVNARIKAMRTALLTPSDYERLMASNDFPEAAGFLENTVYGTSASGAESVDSVEGWEGRLLGEWSRTLRKLFRITDGRIRRGLEVLTGRVEAENLKTVLRGKSAGLEPADILDTVLPTGFFSEAALSEMARQPNLPAVVDLLATWGAHYAKPLKRAFKPGWEMKGLEEGETAVDLQYFRHAREILEESGGGTGLMGDWLGWSIDRVNLLTSIQVSRHRLEEGQDLGKVFIEGGKYITFPMFRSLAEAQGLDTLAEIVGKTPYAAQAGDIVEEEGEIPAFLRLDRGLERFILMELEKAAFSDPLGMGVLMAYLTRKHHEVCNIRILLRGKAYGMYPQDIRSLWVV